MQVIEPIDDMKSFGSEDAQLNLSNGTPRLYIMRLPAKAQGLSFTQITHHKNVTQCLGSLTPEDWCVRLCGRHWLAAGTRILSLNNGCARRLCTLHPENRSNNEAR